MTEGSVTGAGGKSAAVGPEQRLAPLSLSTYNRDHRREYGNTGGTGAKNCRCHSSADLFPFEIIRRTGGRVATSALGHRAKYNMRPDHVLLTDDPRIAGRCVRM